MTTRDSILFLLSGLVVHICSAQNNPMDSVLRDPDRESILSLPWNRFDQTQDSGWRMYANRKQHLEAAKLIEDYLNRHNELSERQRALSHFHAAMQYVFQAREHGGDTHAALAHLDQAMASGKGTGLSADWNDMVIAIKAFLTGDRATLLAVKERVAAMPPSAIRWLKSPDSADDLLNNLGKPYGSWWPREEPKK